MQTKKFIIYKHTNKLNGKSYIGQTCQQLNRRWKNGKGYKESIKFYYAIEKYGWDNFNHQILEENLTLQQANERQIYWINFYDTVNNGYNLREGGQGHYLNTPELRQKHQDAVDRTLAIPVICINTKQRYKSVAEAYRQTGINHITDCCKGKLATAGKDENGYGFIWRYEKDYDEKQIFEFKKISDRSPKRIICINTGKIYNTIKEAQKETGVDSGSISKCCHKKRKSAGKDENGNPLIWRIIYN